MRFLRLLVVLAIACEGGKDPPPSPEPDPPSGEEPQPPPEGSPPPEQPPPPQETPPPPPPPPPPQEPEACFLEEGGHGEWAYHFAKHDGDCGPGEDFTSSMAPGTSFTPWGPIPADPADTDCRTVSNVVSSNRCQKNITRDCVTGFGDVQYRLVESFHQESATHITFSIDYRRDVTVMGEQVDACAGQYFGTITPVE